MAQVLAVPGDRRHGFDVRQQSFVHAFGRITGIAVTMHNLSGSTSNTCMGSSVGMVTNAMFWLDMATS
jgi:hypothetical protein